MQKKWRITWFSFNTDENKEQEFRTLRERWKQTIENPVKQTIVTNLFNTWTQKSFKGIYADNVLRSMENFKTLTIKIIVKKRLHSNYLYNLMYLKKSFIVNLDKSKISFRHIEDINL